MNEQSKKMFISYAQNFEDVILWRLFSDIENGFYVDVGACFPDVCSVTLAFYNAGWSGINIEPNPSVFRCLAEARPRDLNLNLAISDTPGEIKYYEFESEVGSSSLLASYAEAQILRGLPVKELVCSCDTLNNVLQKYAEGRDIHFLKIDVEGFERQVIASCDFNRFRPWVLVIEAMKPWNQVPDHHLWEGALLDANYLFAYADGLNRFYIAAEHSDLLPRFAYPPNVFDRFVLASQHEAEIKAQGVEVRLRKAEHDFAKREREKSQLFAEQEELGLELKEQLENLNKKLQAIYANRSWRITAPLRFIKRSVRWFVNGAWAWLTLKPGSRPRRIANKVIRRGIAAIDDRPGLKQRIVAGAHRLGIYPALRRLYHRIASQRVSTFVVRSVSDKRAYRPEAGQACSDAYEITNTPQEMRDSIHATLLHTIENWKLGRRLNA